MDELPVAEALLVRVELADKDLHSHRGNNTRKRRSVLTEQPTCGHSHWGAPTMVQVQATVLCREEQGSAGHTCKPHNPSLHRTTLTPNPTRGKLNDAERHQGSTHLVGMAEEVGEGVRAAVRLAEGVVVDDTDAVALLDTVIEADSEAVAVGVGHVKNSTCTQPMGRRHQATRHCANTSQFAKAYTASNILP